MTRPLKIQSLLFPILALALTAIALAGITGVIHAQDDEVKVKVKKMDHGWLGITMQDIDAELAEALDLSEGAGVLVNSVIDDSPADKAGLADGDVIVTFAGKEIEDTGDLSRAVRKTQPGDEIEVEVLRDGERRIIAVTVGKREPQVNVWSNQDEGDVFLYSTPGKMKGFKGWHTLMLGEHGYLGVKMQDLNEQLGDYFGVTDGEGVLKGPQWNTYDLNFYGANTFCSGFYLAALRAAITTIAAAWTRGGQRVTGSSCAGPVPCDQEYQP